MIHFIKKLICLCKRKQKARQTPIHIIEDYVSQLSALYAYTKSKDYRDSQRDIINLRIAEIKYEINKQLKELTC